MCVCVCVTPSADRFSNPASSKSHRRLAREMHIDAPSSDEEMPRNTIGDVPLEWSVEGGEREREKKKKNPCAVVVAVVNTVGRCRGVQLKQS